MINNPFTSEVFTLIWTKHFNESAQGFRFAFVRNLLFVKHKLLPVYFNYGKTQTKGISYTIDNLDIVGLKGKVLLIYDVPTFFDITETTQNRIKQLKIKQYPGFLINLEPFKDLNEYMAATFKKSSRYKLKKYKKKLEACFDINYKMFYGEISKEEYDYVFKAFNDMLIKRFDDKQETNNNLKKQEWDFYYEVAYPMIMEKKAGLFVIYNGSKPIGVTLNYFSEDILFDAITVFDIDYAKFHLGSTTIMKLIEWSIQQKLKVFDFSKGYFDYKKRWANKEYDFEYHIWYDSKSLISTIVAKVLRIYLTFKQALRDKKINEKLHRLVFRLKKRSAHEKTKLPHHFKEVEETESKNELIKIDIKKSKYHFLRKPVYDFLYLNGESINDIKVLKYSNQKDTYIIIGNTKKVNLIFNKVN